VLFGYQPAPAASAPPFAVGEPPAADGGSYRLVGEVHAVEDSERRYRGATSTYDPGPPFVVLDRYTVGGFEDRTTTVRYRLGHVSYVRQTWTNDSDYRTYLDRFGAGPYTVRTSDSTRTIYRFEHRRALDSPAPISRFATWELARLAYERRGTETYDGREVVRYVPTRGWTTRDLDPMDGLVTFRVRRATGHVLVDAETGAIVFADVGATVVPAESWADVLTEPDRELRVRYRVDRDVPRPDPPQWVRAVALGAVGQNATAD
jgi:hypothetical protein